MLTVPIPMLGTGACPKAPPIGGAPGAPAAAGVKAALAAPAKPAGAAGEGGALAHPHSLILESVWRLTKVDAPGAGATQGRRGRRRAGERSPRLTASSSSCGPRTHVNPRQGEHRA